MKQLFAASIICVGLVGCAKQDTGSDRGSAPEAEMGRSAKEQKKQIDSAAEEAQRQVKEAAEAQEKRIEAEAKAAKAQIEAQKARAESELKQQQKNVDEQSQRIQEAVGSAQQGISGKQSSDEQLLQQARDSAKDVETVEVSVENGVVTLRGTAKSDEEKASLENRVKQVQGVQDVKNEIKVNNP